ncbi:hypothetical protein RJ639_013121 [Escallonia herrerae]|uniref:HMA domain-containing protein n=1 Tax=Escallonia herrerae TaxID=1293975 RepID=A0AA88VK95_9ASTE|nr:hypothetical protein RJ639_013121 [Escallonia herrerae]
MAVVDRNKKRRAAIGFRSSDGPLLPQTTLASLESLSLPFVEEVVLLADFRCTGCQERVADIISRMNGETDSVVVSVLEKKVTLTCRYPRVVKAPAGQLVTMCRNPMNKFAVVTRLFRSSRS